MATNYLSSIEGIYKDFHQSALVIAGCFVVVALTLSLFLILQHLRSYTNPAEQKWLVAVIFIIPVYATESIISLWNPRLSLACDILRSCYEAFALYSFGRYLIACLGHVGRRIDWERFLPGRWRIIYQNPYPPLLSLTIVSGGERSVVELLERESGEELRKSLLEGSDKNSNLRQRSFYNFFWHPSAVGKDLLSVEKFGLVQYMILKTVCAFLAFLLELFGVYGDGEFKWHYGYPYMAVVLNFSQMWALYCLVQFYNVTHELLEPIKPLAKFISFKAIVFATWWQGVGIALLCAFGVLSKERKGQNGLQDFLICIEMAIAAVAHICVFSAKPYHFLPASAYGKVTEETIKGSLKLNEHEDKPAVLEETETQVEAPGTSIKDSVQDIVVEGGQRIVKDVVLTISQAIGPMEQGVMRIQQTFHRKSEASEEEESIVEVGKEVTGNFTGDENKIDV